MIEFYLSFVPVILVKMKWNQISWYEGSPPRIIPSTCAHCTRFLLPRPHRNLPSPSRSPQAGIDPNDAPPPQPDDGHHSYEAAAPFSVFPASTSNPLCFDHCGNLLGGILTHFHIFLLSACCLPPSFLQPHSPKEVVSHKLLSKF